jgi:hypothetical protein
MDKNLEKKRNLSLGMDVESVNLLITSKNDRFLEALLKNEEISDQIKLIICNYFVERSLHGKSSKEELDILVGGILYNIIKNNASSSSKKAFSEKNEETKYSNEKNEAEVSKEDRIGILQRLVGELNGWNFCIWYDVIIIQIENIIMAIDAKSYKYTIHWRGSSLDVPIEGTLTTFENISKIIKEIIQKQKEAQSAALRAKKQASSQTCAEAALGGHLDILKFLKESNCSWDKDVCSYAALGGHFEILKWARANNCPWNEYTCTNAALKGHIEILKWARENNCP